MATKIRALYQRAKGRDVFDLWLAITQLDVDSRAIAAAFEPYRPDGWTPRLAEQNLVRKISESAYNNDLAQLVRTVPAGLVLADAAERSSERSSATSTAEPPGTGAGPLRYGPFV